MGLSCRTRSCPRFAGGSHSRASVVSLALGDRLIDRETRRTQTVCSSFDHETRKDKSFTAVVLGSAQARRTRPGRERRSLLFEEETCFPHLSPVMRSGKSGFAFAEDADVGEVAVELVGVHAAADEVLRGCAESEPVGLRIFHFRRNGFVDQDAGAAGGGAVRQDHFPEFGERKPGVEDVVDQEDMAVLHVEFQAAAHRELSGRSMVRVGTGGEGIHAHGQIDMAQQVCGEEDSPVHDDDGGKFKSGIRAGDLGGEFLDAAADRLRVVKSGEDNGHRGDQASFAAAFLRVPVVEYPGTNGMNRISAPASSSAARSEGSSDSTV